MMRSFSIFWAFLLAAPLVFSQNTNVVFRKKLTFPGETLANVCGYTANGYEYALVGGSKGTYIIDVTDPDNPVQIVQIPGPNNLWKEIKTYKNYAYVVSEGGFGLQIIDLSSLPSPTLNYHSYWGDGAIDSTLTKAHALHIDTVKGFVYLFGSNLAGGAPIICNLEPDPYNPVYAGRFDQYGYVHDAYIDNDTMYACHIYNGYFSMVDMTNKANPQALAIQNTPNTFPHNAWLTQDRKTVLTTDEVPNSFLAAYDITDPDNIQLLDKIQSNPGSNSMVHNTHVRDNWAVTSWYTDGITIVDVTRPANLIQVGNYDTYSVAAGGSNGCWGVYPFFPSGTLIASNIRGAGSSNGELYILTPTYVRACYLEGQVKDGVTGNNLSGVKVEFIDVSPAISELTGINGRYATGLATPGNYTIRYSKSGYQTLNTLATMNAGEVTNKDVKLYPNGSLNVSGQVIEETNNTPVPNATVQIIGLNNTWSALSDSNGNFGFSGIPPGSYSVHAYSPLIGQVTLMQQEVISTATYTLILKKSNRN